jgi:hypothetical protein
MPIIKSIDEAKLEEMSYPPDPRNAASNSPSNPENRSFLDKLKVSLESMEERVKSDVQNLHIELIRQFTIQ